MDTIFINCTKEEAHNHWMKWKYNNKLPEMIECEICNSAKKLHIHHIDGDRRNNQESNFQILCSKCHFKVHKTFQIRYKKIKEDLWPYSVIRKEDEILI